MLTVLGWLSLAASSASALNRRTSPGLADSSGRSTLIATARFSEICSPR
jgi:hypothetical protein